MYLNSESHLVTQGALSIHSTQLAVVYAPMLHTNKIYTYSYHVLLQEFLMSKEVIHCDLACRNILVAENELLKICDFGLAKETLVYSSGQRIRLPIRWMAPETFLRGEFSEKSDV